MHHQQKKPIDYTMLCDNLLAALELYFAYQFILINFIGNLKVRQIWPHIVAAPSTINPNFRVFRSRHARDACLCFHQIWLWGFLSQKPWNIYP